MASRWRRQPTTRRVRRPGGRPTSRRSGARRSTGSRPTPAIGSSPPTTPRSRPTSRPPSRRRPRRGPTRIDRAPPWTVAGARSSVLDFGSQFAQLIARRVRELDVYSELAAARHDPRGARAPRHARDHPVRRPELGLRRGRAASGPGDLERPHPRPGHLLRRPADGPRARRRRPGRRPPRVRAGERDDHRRRRAVHRPRSRAAGLDEPRRFDHAAAGGFQPDRPDRLDAVRRARRRRTATCTASSSTRRSSTRRAAATSCGTSSSASPASRRRGPPATSSTRRSPASASGSTPTPRATGSDGLVICALSGGVDSAVAAALVHRAVGDRLTCIYVDHGLMRKKESELLRVTFERDLGMNLVMVDARERFLARLAGVEDPEQKRRIIGDEFIRVFEEEAAQARPDRLPDPGHALPGRHRVGHVGDQGGPEDQDPPQRRRPAGGPPLPAHRAAALPVQGRGPRVGLELGLPEAMVLRQPFPGPGLAIRIIGEVTARAAGHAARRGLDRHRRDQGAPACTGPCGRASRSSPRSAPSA